MKIKLKDKDNPIKQLWCFMYSGYESSIIDQINSGKQVEVDKVPKPAWGFVEKIENKKMKKKKESK